MNSVADCLSRMPLPNTGHNYAETIESVALISFASSAISKGDFQTACNNCPVLTKLSTYQQTGWPKYKEDVDLHVQPYFPIRHELAVVEGCMVRGTHRLLVPESLQKKLIDLAHESHQGMVRTKQRLRQLY